MLGREALHMHTVFLIFVFMKVWLIKMVKYFVKTDRSFPSLQLLVLRNIKAFYFFI